MSKCMFVVWESRTFERILCGAGDNSRVFCKERGKNEGIKRYIFSSSI